MRSPDCKCDNLLQLCYPFSPPGQISNEQKCQSIGPSEEDLSNCLAAYLFSRPLFLLWQKNSDRSRCDAGKPGTRRRRRKAPSNCGFDPVRPGNVVGNCLTDFSADIPSSGIFRVVGGDLVLCLRLIEKSSEY